MDLKRGKNSVWIFPIYSPWIYPANEQIYEYNYVSLDNRVELWMRDREGDDGKRIGKKRSVKLQPIFMA